MLMLLFTEHKNYEAHHRILFPNMLFLDTVIVPSSLNARDQISNSSVMTSKIIVFYILAFMPVDSRWENGNF
jgi:hypothetical protein